MCHSGIDLNYTSVINTQHWRQSVMCHSGIDQIYTSVINTPTLWTVSCVS